MCDHLLKDLRAQVTGCQAQSALNLSGKINPRAKCIWRHTVLYDRFVLLPPFSGLRISARCVQSVDGQCGIYTARPRDPATHMLQGSQCKARVSRVPSFSPHTERETKEVMRPLVKSCFGKYQIGENWLSLYMVK